ncbi:glycosyltransferase family 2 protein [Streptomyces sp. TP-A0874]|uniref:glycosyltransferase family 2 protein n=1 Tax=Streptomyces sp. TP-A0874 TaxID=549819 RepID=UPI0008528D5B|nr:glycosyltransferase [Streptomyces sp. TP-A0874]
MNTAPHRYAGSTGPGTPENAYSVVVPTVGRDCLAECLWALGLSGGPPPREVVVVDDRPDPAGPLVPEAPGPLSERTRVLTSGGRGPAAARNTGLRAVDTPWVVFLDDDVRVRPDWPRLLSADLAAADPAVGGVQGRLQVPLPEGRRPTDWERGTAGLEEAAWATADMAYRTETLREVGGFDERFTRAFREDADLALRVLAAGWSLRRGERVTDHPVRRADRWASLRAQRGNADDVLMGRLHGRDWWSRARAPRGRLPRHLVVTATALATVLLGLTGRRTAAAVSAAVWAAGTAEFAGARIAPGPRTRQEVATMVCTSVVIPPAAVGHWLAGLVRHRDVTAWQGAG